VLTDEFAATDEAEMIDAVDAVEEIDAADSEVVVADSDDTATLLLDLLLFPTLGRNLGLWAADNREEDGFDDDRGFGARRGLFRAAFGLKLFVVTVTTLLVTTAIDLTVVVVAVEAGTNGTASLVGALVPPLP
jgi:hypothetical protein